MNSNNKTTKDWRDKGPDNETSEKWRRDPNNWKLGGLFYYNKEDKRLFVPKKVEWMGITINFANRKSVLFMIGAMFFFAFVTYTILRNK